MRVWVEFLPTHKERCCQVTSLTERLQTGVGLLCIVACVTRSTNDPFYLMQHWNMLSSTLEDASLSCSRIQVSQTIFQCRVIPCAFIVIQRVKLLRHLCEFCSGFFRNSAECAEILFLYFTSAVARELSNAVRSRAPSWLFPLLYLSGRSSACPAMCVCACRSARGRKYEKKTVWYRGEKSFCVIASTLCV